MPYTPKKIVQNTNATTLGSQIKSDYGIQKRKVSFEVNKISSNKVGRLSSI